MSGIAQVLYQQWVLRNYLLAQLELQKQTMAWAVLPYVTFQKEES